jgi:hypothetical protein
VEGETDKFTIIWYLETSMPTSQQLIGQLDRK